MLRYLSFTLAAVSLVACSHKPACSNCLNASSSGGNQGGSVAGSSGSSGGALGSSTGSVLGASSGGSTTGSSTGTTGGTSTGTISTRPCGDGVVDPSNGEECDGGPDCNGLCQWLPCLRPNPCATATRDPAGVCVPQSLDDGTPCDDGNACTTNDICTSGVCSGTPAASVAANRGELTTFGASPDSDDWLNGAALFLSDERLVFLDTASFTTSTLSLVAVSDSGLTRLATASSALGFHDNIDWVYLPTTRLIQLSATRFAVVAGSSDWTVHGIEVFDTTGDTLSSEGITDMPSDGPDAFGVAARADALWICGAGELQSWGHTGGTALTLLSRGGVSTCNALAVSSDGNTLFVAGSGLSALDVSTNPIASSADNVTVPEICPAGTLTPGCHFFAQTLLYDVQANADYVAVLTGDNVGDPLGVQVLSAHDGSVLQQVTNAAGGATAGEAIGMALSDHRVFVEWYAFAPHWTTLSVAVHPLDTGSTEPLASFKVRDNCCGGEPWTLLSFAARGARAALQPYKRVVSFAGETLAALTGNEHGSLKGLAQTGNAMLTSVGPYASHVIDITDADHPSIVSGGMSLPAADTDLQFLTAPSLGLAPTLANTPTGIFFSLTQNNTEQLFTLYDVTQPPASMRLGNFWIDGELDGKTLLAAGGGLLFQARAVNDADIRLRRYQPNGGIGLDRQQLLPDIDTVISGTPVAAFTEHVEAAFGVADTGDAAVFLDLRGGTTGGVYAPVVTWLAVTAQSASIVASQRIDSVPLGSNQILVHGDDAIVGNDEGIVRLHLDGTTLTQQASFASPSIQVLFERLLFLDGENVAYAQHAWPTPTEDQWTVEVLKASDLSSIASYPTSRAAQTLTVVGNEWVIGMDSAVSVVDPVCP